MVSLPLSTPLQFINRCWSGFPCKWRYINVETFHLNLDTEGYLCDVWRAPVWRLCRCAFTTSRVTTSLPGSRHSRPRPPGLSRRRWWRSRAGVLSERRRPKPDLHHVVTARPTEAGCWSPEVVSVQLGTSLQIDFETSALVRLFLSDFLTFVAKRYILQQASEQVNRKCP